MRKPDPDGWLGIDLGLDYTRTVVCAICRKVTIVMHNSGPVRCAHCGVCSDKEKTDDQRVR